MIPSLTGQLKPLYVALGRQDQLVLNQLFESAQQYRAELSNTGTLLPLEIVLMVILLDEHKRLGHIHVALRAELQELGEATPSAAE